MAAEAAAAREYADLSLRRMIITASRAGISQRTIAHHIGRSQPEVHRILGRATRALPHQRDPAYRTLRREERVQYELHHTLAEKVTADPEQYRELAHRNIDRMRSMVRGTTAHRWLDDWQHLVDGPTDRLTATMLRLDGYGIDMRQVSPFAGALTELERLRAIERANTSAA